MKTRKAFELRFFICLAVWAIPVYFLPAKLPALTSSETLYRQGYSVFQTGNYHEALKFFQDAIVLDPKFESAYKGLGTCYYRLGDYTNALKAYENVLFFEPQNPKIQTTVQWLRAHAVPAIAQPALPPQASAVPKKPLDNLVEIEQPRGFFGGLYLPVNTVSGGFDGKTLLQSTVSGEWVAVPTLSNGLGYGIFLGWKDFGGFFKPFALEATYQQTLCNAHWDTANGQADFYVIDLSLQYHLMPGGQFDFYGISGGSVSRIWVKGGSLYQQQVGDTIYDFTGFHIGGGASFQILKGLTLNTEIIYRYLYPFQVTGADQVAQNAIYELRGDGFGFKMGLQIYPLQF